MVSGSHSNSLNLKILYNYQPHNMFFIIRLRLRLYVRLRAANLLICFEANTLYKAHEHAVKAHFRIYASLTLFVMKWAVWREDINSHQIRHSFTWLLYVHIVYMRVVIISAILLFLGSAKWVWGCTTTLGICFSLAAGAYALHFAVKGINRLIY